MSRSRKRKLDDQEIEMQVRNRQAREVGKGQLGAGIVGGTIMGTIFSMFSHAGARAYLESTLKTVLFPVVMCLDIIQAILAWKQAQLSGFKKGAVAKASLETAGALAVSAAVIGGFVATAAFTLAAPVIFVAVMGLKTLYHAGLSIYSGVKAIINKVRANRTDDPTEKANYTKKFETYRGAAIDNAVSTVSLALTTVAIGLVMIGGKTIFGLLGAAAAVIGIGYAVVKAVQLHNAKESKVVTEEARQPLLGEGTKGIAKGLGLSSDALKPEAKSDAPPPRSKNIDMPNPKPHLKVNDKTYSHSYTAPRQSM